MSFYQLEYCADGSSTVRNTHIDECYHSHASAIQESQHVYIVAGLEWLNLSEIKILEVGFGTGLNALLSLIYAQSNVCNIQYDSLEYYPLPQEAWQQLNYPDLLQIQSSIFYSLHQSDWNVPTNINSQFRLCKYAIDALAFETDQQYNLIYFDAFSPDKQSELWSEKMFCKMYSLLKPGGILLSYSAKGTVKQNLRSAGFEVIRLKGFGEKHHMIRAKKSKS